jgi:hypothetical protein
LEFAMHVRTAHAVSIAVGLLLVWATALLFLAGTHSAVRADQACYWARVSGSDISATQAGPVCHDFGTPAGCNYPDAGIDPWIDVTGEACVPD